MVFGQVFILTERTDGGAFLYLFSRFRFGFCVVSCDVSDGVDSPDMSLSTKLGSTPGYEMYCGATCQIKRRVKREKKTKVLRRTVESIGLVEADDPSCDSES
jgi:hypothetical protein